MRRFVISSNTAPSRLKILSKARRPCIEIPGGLEPDKGRCRSSDNIYAMTWDIGSILENAAGKRTWYRLKNILLGCECLLGVVGFFEPGSRRHSFHHHTQSFNNALQERDRTHHVKNWMVVMWPAGYLGTMPLVKVIVGLQIEAQSRDGHVELEAAVICRPRAVLAKNLSLSHSPASFNMLAQSLRERVFWTRPVSTEYK